MQSFITSELSVYEKYNTQFSLQFTGSVPFDAHNYQFSLKIKKEQ